MNNNKQGSQSLVVNSNINSRLDLIESNLNRVCNQHDALMPLLNLLELLPSLQKNENIVKTIQRKQQEFE